MSTDFYIQNGPITTSDLVAALYQAEGISFAYFDDGMPDFIVAKSLGEIQEKLDQGSGILIMCNDDYLWVNYADGFVRSFERRGKTNVSTILNAIEGHVGIKLWTDSSDYRRTADESSSSSMVGSEFEELEMTEPTEVDLEFERWWNAVGRYIEAEISMIEEDPNISDSEKKEQTKELYNEYRDSRPDPTSTTTGG